MKGPSKKRRLLNTQERRKQKDTGSAKGKEKAADRGFIAIPVGSNDSASELSDEDVELLEEYGQAVGFLSSLDEKGITRCVACVCRSV